MIFKYHIYIDILMMHVWAQDTPFNQGVVSALEDLGEYKWPVWYCFPPLFFFLCPCTYVPVIAFLYTRSHG